VKADEYGVGVTNVKTKANKENVMLTIIIILALFVVLDIMALRWSVDTTDGITSGEWERRSRRYVDADDQLMYC
jgi:hypothetical protein